jgi:hypothetical protein
VKQATFYETESSHDCKKKGEAEQAPAKKKSNRSENKLNRR